MSLALLSEQQDYGWPKGSKLSVTKTNRVQAKMKNMSSSFHFIYLDIYLGCVFIIIMFR